MGQHKYNPNCQLAKEGKLPPKEKPMSKREFERVLYAKIREMTGVAALERYMHSTPYGR